MSKTRPGRALSGSGDGGALPADDYPPTGTRRFAAASPYTPLEHPIGGVNLHETSSRVHSRSPITPGRLAAALGAGKRHRFPPVFSSPAAPEWNESRFGFYPGLRTPRLPATHAERRPRPFIASSGSGDRHSRAVCSWYRAPRYGPGTDQRWTGRREGSAGPPRVRGLGVLARGVGRAILRAVWRPIRSHSQRQATDAMAAVKWQGQSAGPVIRTRVSRAAHAGQRVSSASSSATYQSTGKSLNHAGVQSFSTARPPGNEAQGFRPYRFIR